MTDTHPAESAPRRDRRRSPRMRNGEQRSRLTVYLSPDERALLEARAANTGESMARILVQSALHPAAAEIQTAADITLAVEQLRWHRRQLAGIATNLNQVAHHANAAHEVPADFARVVAQVDELTDTLSALLAEVRR
ncbi:MobC family plasmid mobilization relaxosome protein [Actinomyces succiniciruminis]|uniref:Bacterial mobilisation protein (MobC) n=1 Tax=Actinomyces succiniciruminis TaxID=1522002 RepID=A0A1L7RBN9_9ACTO|nr:MobC family plasmid mobilization relaxosome protein [Actinomyces succiniciruminis]CED91301.1 Bacterial mobilisation protein (MobC) [Actinomyces succiniciruminis]